MALETLLARYVAEGHEKEGGVKEEEDRTQDEGTVQCTQNETELPVTVYFDTGLPQFSAYMCVSLTYCCAVLNHITSLIG